MVSSGGVPRREATFARVMPVYFLSFSFLKPTRRIFSGEPVAEGSFRPRNGEYIVYAQDVGGGEFMQLFRHDFEDGLSTLLTDGKSRNTGARWARSGGALAYTSTRRNGRDNDLYVMNPAEPDGNRLVAQVTMIEIKQSPCA